MKYTEITFKTPEENLACDEALLDLCEDGHGEEILRFWEPNQYFVVLGYSGKANQEVNLAACQKNKVPVLRRSSGGGTVLQGPGCLNFSLILDTQNGRPLKNLIETNQHVMEKHKQALEPLIKFPISVEGFTDLALKPFVTASEHSERSNPNPEIASSGSSVGRPRNDGKLKFSGNAQRRKKRFLLFHGSFLLRFNIELMEQFLPLPTQQPAYRNNRTHLEFLTNLNLSNEKIKKLLRQVWSAEQKLEQLPRDRIEKLAKERYADQNWNFKF